MTVHIFYYPQIEPSVQCFYSEERLVNLVRWRECFLVYCIYVISLWVKCSRPLLLDAAAWNEFFIAVTRQAISLLYVLNQISPFFSLDIALRSLTNGCNNIDFDFWTLIDLNDTFTCFGAHLWIYLYTYIVGGKSHNENIGTLRPF